MALFMIEWTSLDPKVSSSLFVSGVLKLPEKMKIIASVHLTDEPRGFVLTDCTAADVYNLVVSLPPGVLDIKVEPVIDDNEARKGLSKRNAGLVDAEIASVAPAPHEE